jgi:FkbM family methyltransferase
MREFDNGHNKFLMMPMPESSIAPSEVLLWELISDLLRRYDDRPDRLWLDVGGNIGYVGVSIASAKRKTWIFEPQPTCCFYIGLEVVQSKAMDHAKIWMNYVGDDVREPIRVRGNIGCAVGWIAKDDTKLANKAWAQNQGIPGIFADNVASGVRLDDILPDSVTEIPFLKIDTEGGEYNVLRGAIKTLRRKVIKNMFVELSPPFQQEHGISTSELADLIHHVMELGYHFFPVQMADAVHCPCSTVKTRFGDLRRVHSTISKAELVALFDNMRAVVSGMNAWFVLGDTYL